MPKIINTRRQAALKLLRTLEQGPSFEDPSERNKNWDDADQGFRAQYRRWASTCVIPEVKRLVPELKLLATGK